MYVHWEERERGGGRETRVVRKRTMGKEKAGRGEEWLVSGKGCRNEIAHMGAIWLGGILVETSKGLRRKERKNKD